MNGDLLSTLEGPEGCSRPRLIQSPTEGNCMIYYDKGHFCLFSVNGKLLKHVEVEDSIKVKGGRKGKNKIKLSTEQNFCSGFPKSKMAAHSFEMKFKGNKLYASVFLAFITFVLLYELKAFSPMELFCCSTSSGHRGKTQRVAEMPVRYLVPIIHPWFLHCVSRSSASGVTLPPVGVGE